MAISRIPQWLVVISSIIVALVTLRFLPLGMQAAFPDMSQHLAERNLAFLLHIGAGPVALVMGVFQFMPRLRAKRPTLHRWTGRIYVMAVLIAGLAGLALALGSLERPVAAWGFGLLALFWLVTTVNAIRLAIAGRFSEHRRWMIRSFALTFAAVTLRLMLPYFIFYQGMDYAQASNYVGWLCWIPNMIFAEWYIRKNP